MLVEAPAFDPANATREHQERQAGYNCDFTGFLPHTRGGDESDRGLLCVSFEYPDVTMMVPPFDGRSYDRRLADMLLASHGLGVVEVSRGADGRWGYRSGGARNRRVTPFSTLELRGPVAGHDRMKTRAHPDGRRVHGTVFNCSGGLTPWGTWLQAEENFHVYFRLSRGNRDSWLAKNAARQGIGERSAWAFERFHDRFDLDREPNEANRFGWIVELDPYDPSSPAVKRTALGRFHHEAASVAITPKGHAAVYMGDDAAFEYVYKFVSEGRFDPDRGAANGDLLDRGRLYAARFDDDGTGRWLPLVFGEGPLTKANGFADQADVLLRTREAADAVGATPMDRPEDVEATPADGRVFIACTGSGSRTAAQIDSANPRAPNRDGHVIEIVEDGGDGASTTFKWDILLLCGPASRGADYGGHTDASPLSRPDNLAIDPAGNLWVATDGQEGAVGANDGAYLVPIDGKERGRSRQLLSSVPGAEVTGPSFTPDGTTMFVAIQHPGSVGRGSSYTNPGTRWPDRDPTLPPRPSVIAVTREDGGVVGA